MMFRGVSATSFVLVSTVFVGAFGCNSPTSGPSQPSVIDQARGNLNVRDDVLEHGFDDDLGTDPSPPSSASPLPTPHPSPSPTCGVGKNGYAQCYECAAAACGNGDPACLSSQCDACKAANNYPPSSKCGDCARDLYPNVWPSPSIRAPGCAY